MTKEMERLENVVKDAYIVYPEDGGLSADEQQQHYTALIQKADELQRQYGSEMFSYRSFEFIKYIAAVIKDKEIIEALVKEGYTVKEQGRFTV